ncbi:hypothetical protein OIE66_15670 [Nonomuraea sp. NBC_01738]|uniref:hypothetical protein n=1 Tax=Nonomuraea sp. NBC_01738 TaxID=2976003 RepID=UPI002E11AD28|nr:hypothetical protein OIE66_15670 [Nonomuraea sp. NBC_01738]
MTRCGVRGLALLAGFLVWAYVVSGVAHALPPDWLAGPPARTTATIWVAPGGGTVCFYDGEWEHRRFFLVNTSSKLCSPPEGTEVVRLFCDAGS